jgi:gas vesicle protein
MKFILGFAIGLGMALLVAPASGTETRRQIKERIRELAHLPHKKLEHAAEAAKAQAGELGSKIGREAAEAAVEKITDQVLGTEKSA